MMEDTTIFIAGFLVGTAICLLGANYLMRSAKAMMAEANAALDRAIAENKQAQKARACVEEMLNPKD